jgi:putative SOS response-associated peptidase YedK
VPARGYYEWSPRGQDGKVRSSRSTSIRPHPAGDRSVLAFAGLYEMWRNPSKADDDPNRWLWSTVIITTDATGPAGDVTTARR